MLSSFFLVVLSCRCDAQRKDTPPVRVSSRTHESWLVNVLYCQVIFVSQVQRKPNLSFTWTFSRAQQEATAAPSGQSATTAVSHLEAERLQLHRDLQRCVYEIQQRDQFLQQLNAKVRSRSITQIHNTHINDTMIIDTFLQRTQEKSESRRKTLC